MLITYVKALRVIRRRVTFPDINTQLWPLGELVCQTRDSDNCCPPNPNPTGGTGGEGTNPTGGQNSVIIGCCGDIEIPTTLWVVISNGTGGMLGHDGMYTMTYRDLGGGDAVWETIPFPWMGNTRWHFTCVSGTWLMGYSPRSNSYPQCTPFFSSDHETNMPGTPSTGAFDWVVSDNP